MTDGRESRYKSGRNKMRALGRALRRLNGEEGRRAMHCVLVWRDTRRGGALVSGTAFGIGAGLLRPQGRRARLPDPLSLARAELGLRRAVLQASHVSALVRMTEAALLHDPAQHDEPALSQAARP